MWLARCVWSGRKVGWAFGLIAFYLLSFAFAIALVLATEGTAFAPGSFVALLALVLASLLASLVLLAVALFGTRRANSAARDAKVDA